MKGKILVCLFLAVLLLGCFQMSAEDIAETMQQKYESIESMKGTVVTTSFVGEEKQTRKSDFWREKPNKYRSESENMTAVFNGSVLWIYDKNKNEVTVMQMESANATGKTKFGYADLIKEMLQRSKIEVVGSEEVSGRDCYVVKQTPKNETYYEQKKLWIDKEFWFPLKIKTEGKYNTTVVYKDVEFNTNINDSKFEFNPPEDAKVVKKDYEPPEKLTVEEARDRVNFTILTPEYTSGYEFSHASSLGDNRTVMLTFKKDDKKLTIMEQPITEAKNTTSPSMNATKVEIDGKKGKLMDLETARILNFNANKTDITISGRLNKEEIIKVAESMV